MANSVVHRHELVLKDSGHPEFKMTFEMIGDRLFVEVFWDEQDEGTMEFHRDDAAALVKYLRPHLKPSRK